ncbi:MAG: hypothetical protein WB949_09680 [Candidatus Acidiferrales bacterium]
MKKQNAFLLLLANGFVGYYYWNEYRHGMSAGRMLGLLVVSLVGINLALILGQWLGERRARQLAVRRSQRK